MTRTHSTLTLATLAALGLAAATPQQARAQAPTPIAGTGYNQDVVQENSGAGNPNYADSFDGGGTAWIENGLEGDTGLPAESGPDTTVSVVSAAANAVTGGNTTFEFQSYGGAAGAASDNVLLDRSGGGVTFTLATPAAYSSLAVDAASGNASGSSQGSLVLNFVGGATSAPIAFSAFDWYDVGQHGGADVLAADVSRGYSGYNADSSGTGVDPYHINSFNVYETDINLASLGYSGQAISSITFTKASDAGTTGVFGVSGVAAAPEPSQFAALGVGLLGLTGLALRARKRA